MVPFALLARRGCSTPCGLSLALAAELRVALPFDEPTRERLQHDLRRVRARLN
jgi:hypothetical protein